MDSMTKAYDRWIGRDAYGRDGGKVGTIESIYYDDQTGRPEWVAVTTGLFGHKVTLAPIAGSSRRDDDLQLAHDRDTVEDAPNCEVDGELSEEEERRLFSHYRFDWERTATSGYGDQARADSGFDAGGRTSAGSGGGDAMTRSEEELRAGKVRRPTGRARLHKYVVTEYQQVTVPVTREEVRVEREPITDANVDDAMAGAAITEREHEVVTHEERPVVSTETVPKERIDLEGGAGDQASDRAEPAIGTGSTSSLDDLTRDELYTRARQLGIRGRSKMTKAELLRAVSGPAT